VQQLDTKLVQEVQEVGLVQTVKMVEKAGLAMYFLLEHTVVLAASKTALKH
jgi:hypothetical protein